MGKGSKRRNEDKQKVDANWDLIFGKDKKKNETPEDNTEIEKTAKTVDSAETK